MKAWAAVACASASAFGLFVFDGCGVEDRAVRVAHDASTGGSGNQSGKGSTWGASSGSSEGGNTRGTDGDPLSTGGTRDASLDMDTPDVAHRPDGDGADMGGGPSADGPFDPDASAGTGGAGGAGGARDSSLEDGHSDSDPDVDPRFDAEGGATRPSCAGLGRLCGPRADDDCCAGERIPGGTFTMGRDASTAPANRPQHPVELSSFELDRYEVSVSRFSRYVDAYDQWSKPKPDDGRYQARPNTGWRAEWNALLAPNAQALAATVRCDATYATWTSDPRAATSPLAMNCLPWHQAYAFCIWDGGRLPTEAEWEYAAAGGREQRDYPWGNTWNPDYPNYNLKYYFVTPVGQAGLGQGRGLFGQYDLVGNVWEWVRDAYDPGFYATLSTAQPTNDPVNPFGLSGYPVVRGASWIQNPIETTLSYHRYSSLAADPNSTVGVRCARDLQ